MSRSARSAYATVVIPTHDRFSTLAAAVRSVQGQTVRDLEIMIAGDGATAKVREIALGLAAGDPRVVFHDWPKAEGRGGDNRDRAVQAATNERIFYNDDDDLFLPQHVERLGPVLDEHDAADDAAASVSLSGRLQVAIANHSRGPMRDALAAATAKVTFDTHFAHRKSTYRRLGNPWSATDRPVAWNLFQAFAGDPTVKWRTIPGVSALSFHGAARRHLSGYERRTELEDWQRRLSTSVVSDLASAVQYDWYVFTLARALSPPLPLRLGAFLHACHIRLGGPADDAGGNLSISIPDDRIEALRNVFAILRKEPIGKAAAADLAVNLADPLLGTRPRHQQVAGLLTEALGAGEAIDAVTGYRPADDHSHETRECLLFALLLRDGRLVEARARVRRLLDTAYYYRADAFALAAALARRQAAPGEALGHARAAISFEPSIAEAHSTAVWALIALGRMDAARDALAKMKVTFPSSVVATLEEQIENAARAPRDSNVKPHKPHPPPDGLVPAMAPPSEIEHVGEITEGRAKGQSGANAGISQRARWFLRNVRRALTLVRWLGTGQFSRAVDASLPYYRRYAPMRVRMMVSGFMRSGSGDWRQVIRSESDADGSSPKHAAMFRWGFAAPSASPRVSIIIAAFNKVDYTLRCLDSVRRNTIGDFEVIVVDDCSSDQTPQLLACIPNLRIIRNERNLGFLRSSNRGAEEARSENLIFLNNDTEVTMDWLPPLLELYARKDVGAVGPKLVYPDGRLQEAGAIYWRDASGANYGNGCTDPGAPQFNYVREVDKCSGACLLVRKDIFFENGEGFDTLFAPAYKEDADLCFRVRRLGFRVMYQPASTVIHHEGVSNGKDIASGVKQYQELNRPKFVEKWRDVLEREHLPNATANILIARERPYRRKVALVVDDRVPEPDRHAGGLGMYHYTRLLVDLGYKVVFFPDNKRRIDPYTSDLQQLGVEILYGKCDLDSILKENGENIEVAWLSRPTVAYKHIDRVRSATKAKILYCGRDLHFLRTQRHAEINGDEALVRRAEELKALELGLFAKADTVLTFSQYELDLIAELCPLARARIIAPYVMEVAPEAKAPAEASSMDVLYIGAFKHGPNADAAMWFLRACWPAVKQAIPGARFIIIGSDPPQALLDRVGADVLVTGHVRDLGPFFRSALASVAPLRYGAGVKGKIVTSMSHNCPVVSTNIGAEGMGLTDGGNVLIADRPEDFVSQLTSLHLGSAKRKAIVEGGRAYVATRYSKAVVTQAFETILDEVGAFIPQRAR